MQAEGQDEALRALAEKLVLKIIEVGRERGMDECSYIDEDRDARYSDQIIECKEAVLAALLAQPERAREAMRERVEAALVEWTRPSAIRLMIGETITAQEGRTANAVAAMLAAKVRRALPLTDDEGGGA